MTTVVILAFSPENPTVCTVSAGDAALLTNDDTLILSEFSTPHEDLDGSLGIVANLTTSDFQLEGVDLSAIDTTDVTATATIDEAVPSPSPPPNPGDPGWVASPTPPPVDPANMYPSPGHAIGYYPSPGDGPIPVAPHPDAPASYGTAAAQNQGQSQNQGTLPPNTLQAPDATPQPGS